MRRSFECGDLLIRRGQQGRVLRVDAGGDVLIRFEDRELWVLYYCLVFLEKDNPHTVNSTLRLILYLYYLLSKTIYTLRNYNIYVCVLFHIIPHTSAFSLRVRVLVAIKQCKRDVLETMARRSRNPRQSRHLASGVKYPRSS